MPQELAANARIGGDYNVIGRDHEPRHRGFLQFEYGLLETLEAIGYVDAYASLYPGEQAHSWSGRTGDGYRYAARVRFNASAPRPRGWFSVVAGAGPVQRVGPAPAGMVHSWTAHGR